MSVCHYTCPLSSCPVFPPQCLKNVVLYVLLAPHDNEQSDLKHRVYEEKKLLQLPIYRYMCCVRMHMSIHAYCLHFVVWTICHSREILESFRRQELLDWDTFQSRYGPALREGAEDGPATTVFVPDTELGERQWQDLRKRVIEHVSIV